MAVGALVEAVEPVHFPALWDDVPPHVNSLSRDAIGEALKVHHDLGPGLLEAPYAKRLAQRLASAGLRTVTEWPVPAIVDGEDLGIAYRADIVVEDVLLIEVKALPWLMYRHVAQPKTYVRMGRYPLGLLFNFQPPRLEIRRIVP